ncbi:MAG: G1 family glutamic endopeptidase [Solirubrobacteraceae bacterium]
MNKRALIPIIPALACASLLAAPAALAAEPEAVSQNWSGYEVASNNSENFSNVSGSWVQPTATCTSGNATYSAFWVGLGGGSDQSQALEQVGTQSDCDANGDASYFAWYELVPSAPVQLNLTINPGDQITSSVHVSGTSVTISLSDQTTGRSVTKTLSMSSPDTSTAEWIAEAPSECADGAAGECQPLALADFGSVKFTSASATSDGHTGTISDSDWTAQPLALAQNASGSPAGAQPSSLSSDGSYFTVTYSADGAVDVTTGDPGADGYGYSSGYGYGYGDGGGSGYGYGGGSGYGYPGGYGYGGESGYGYPGSYGYSGAYSYSGSYANNGYVYGY